MTNKLEPCPFQKEGEVHELEWVDVGALKWVRCKTCNAQGPCDESKERARELWNTRYKRTCKPYQTSDGWTCPVCNWSGLTWGVQKCCSGCGTQLDWR